MDQSTLQVQLVVKRDDKLAGIRPINLTKDHQKNDQIELYPLFRKVDLLGPANLMQTSKVK